MSKYFEIHNRRYLGSKHKLLEFIKEVVVAKCDAITSFCDIFAGTGVVGARFNDLASEVISNDLLASNRACLQAFLGVVENNIEETISEKMNYLNQLSSEEDNYFSTHFGGTYFTEDNARKIGVIREEIDNISDDEDEKNILICSLLYAADKVANTVGHYDAFRRDLDMLQPLILLFPKIDYSNNTSNKIYQENANELVKEISCDVLYIDPPYNSRQYSDMYHLLENLAEWKQSEVIGVAKKMDRSHIKSKYCLKDAAKEFSDLIQGANCEHIFLSYNNTGDSMNGRSNARIPDSEILRILTAKGYVETFEMSHKGFTTGKNVGENNTERLFYCRVA